MNKDNGLEIVHRPDGKFIVAQGAQTYPLTLSETEEEAGMHVIEILAQRARFSSGHELAAAAWKRDHKSPPPVYVNPLDGRFEWMNRATRRKLGIYRP